MKQAAVLKQKQLSLLRRKHVLLGQQPHIKYVPHSKQSQFHAAGAESKERLFLAGNRCGKTFCGAFEMVVHLTGFYPPWWCGKRYDKPIQGWAASITAEMTRDIVQRTYLDFIHPDLIVRKTMRKGVSDALDVLHVRHISGGTSVLGFKSFDQGREKFQGTSRHFIHLDEEPDMAIYEECLMRTLDVGGSLILTMTPLKGMTDVCAHYMEGSDPHRAIVQATWDDALHLESAEKDKLRSSLRPHELEAREKGIPSLGRGKVYTVKEADITCEPFELPPTYRHAFGMDFGWSNPTAVVWGALDPETDILYLYDSYARSEQTPAQHAASIHTRGEWIPGVCDPAGQSQSQHDGKSLMEVYSQQGLYLTQADNGVEAGLMAVLERMRTGRLKVFNTLEGWWQEFRLYRRDENGRIVKRSDHLMDATRYLVMSGLPLARPAPAARKTAPVRKRDWTTL
ncbi:MAG: DNA packaging protein [Proteobacteria bacterium]|nr:DNA packaging protein [Pseudomonadota bacterium]